MMRLHRHDEIVEAMAARIYANIPDASALESQRAAWNALDAMLEAVVRLETTKQGVLLGTEKQWVACTLTEENRLGAPDVLILRMEARDDE